MKDNSKNNFEEILSKALELRENGESEHEIFRRFPAHRKDLAEVFLTLKTLRASKQSLTAPPDVLRRIIERLPELPKTGAVTKSEYQRYTGYSEAKGRTFFINLQKVIKTSFSRAFVPAGLVIVLLAITLAVVQLPKKDTDPASPVAVITSPAITGKPDSAADSFAATGSVSGFKQRVEQAKTNVPPELIARPDTTRPKPRRVGL